jgi:hypothetical protein
MAIPKKPQESPLKKRINNTMEAVSKARFSNVREIPPLKLIKWTMFFFTSSLSIYLITGGALDLVKAERRLRDARRMEELGYVSRRAAKIDNVGNAKQFASDYGFDYTKRAKNVENIVPDDK